MPLTNRAGIPREARRVSPDRLFRLDTPTAPTLARRVTNAAAPSLERLLYVSNINDIYDAVRHETDRGLFIQGVLEFLDVRLRVSSDDLARVPKTGPAIVVANHPFGAIEGILMARLLASVRDDVKIMANFLLHRIPQLRDLFIFVDPFGGESAAARNVRPLREAIRWVRDGGLLVVFPAGEVAHLDVKRRQVLDPPWSPTVGRIARKTAAPVVPMFFTGHNSAAFQLAGLLHPRLRTALLPRELMNKRHKRLEVRVGSPVPARKLASFEGDAEATDYLRQRAYMLRHRAPRLAAAKPVPADTQRQHPVVAELDPALLAREVAALPAAQKLATADGLAVYEATAGQIPAILQEIGRLREITFRATGEGTGNPIDLDRFDAYYSQLFIWSEKTRQVVGGYRLGRSDVILAGHGKEGLYTHSLFNYRAELLDRVGPALEMGRSFVRAEFQRSYAPLLLLWKGIGRVCVNEPRYRMLFGPVSISNTYQSVSRQMMVQFLRLHHGLPLFSDLVHPRNPFRLKRVSGFDEQALRGALRNCEEMNDLVSEVEPDQKGMPVLLRQYLKLGAKLLAFNVDPQFSDVVDGLILVDLAKTDPKLLDRYLGKEGAPQFLAYHAAKDAALLQPA